MSPQQSDLFDGASYPHAPGFAQTDTSRAAAERLKPTAAALRDRVFMALKVKPMTSLELAKHLGEAFESVQPRTSELRAQNLIIDSGKRGPTRCGKLKGIVWTVAP